MSSFRRCDGCWENQEDVSRFIVTDHNHVTSYADYCPECADLARRDWNGATASITIRPMGDTQKRRGS